MIQEAYVSFEVARLLKEKGFDEPCITLYEKKDGNFIHLGQFIGDPSFIDWNEDMFIYAPTQQIAMRWLREIHNLHCDILYDIEEGWDFKIVNFKETVRLDYDTYKIYHNDGPAAFQSYEDAVEAAIKYALENLI